ncbi:MAG: exo-alpha-sialidase [Oligoflexia bacterium]|nr:exo-alpha-sialidase [Oligoflexia bacterium]
MPPGAGPAPDTSGAQIQDPSGFPMFHSLPAPPGPPIDKLGDWTNLQRLSIEPGGGYRPQIVSGPDGHLHVVYYQRTDHGDLIRHRHRPKGGDWTTPVLVGFDQGRNWGPDIVARQDGSVVVVFDHSRADLTSRGYITTWQNDTWSEPQPLTPQDGEEIGSGHVADAVGDDLAYVWIGKPVGTDTHFAAHWRWRKGSTWAPRHAFTDGTQDAWHTNVERRPDGSVLAGWDVGVGGTATTLFVADGRDGEFSTPENITALSHPGERVHFAFGDDGVDHLTWFHKKAGLPRAVYVLNGHPGAWGQAQEPSQGKGGFQFDPDIAVNSQGVLCLVWGWDSGADADLVYSLNKGQGWSDPRKVAELDGGKPGLPSIAVDDSGAFNVVWNQGVRGRSQVWYARLVVR